MNRSFVKNAPEIAEELLLKAAGLPKELSSFSRDLLNREASQKEDEKLALPARMSLADLQKMASAKGENLPKIASADVSVEDWAKTASDLVAIAKRAEAEDAQDVLATAAALVAHNKSAAGTGGPVISALRPRAARAVAKPITAADAPGIMTRIKGAIMPHSPAGRDVKDYNLKRDVQEAGIRKNLPKDPAVQAKEIEAQTEKEKGERRNRLAEHTIAAAPAIGLAAGTPLAAAAILKGDKEKKEEVKIYK